MVAKKGSMNFTSASFDPFIPENALENLFRALSEFIKQPWQWPAFGRIEK